MIKIFNLRIMSARELAEIIQKTVKIMETQEGPVLNCGYKSCQFQTTDPKGLKIHRARIHRKK